MSIHETHRVHRAGWLRAAVLGANDGIVSTASLIIGVAAASTTHNEILVAGVAGLVAGAMSMATGEYVSVSSQADIEKADLIIEQESLNNNREFETRELANIYIERGLNTNLAQEVAHQLMAHDALGAHARDELGIIEHAKARPIQAAFASACTFTLGAALPLIAAVLSPLDNLMVTVGSLSLLFLAILGALAARAGGAPILKAALRVTLWGSLAMIITAAIGGIFTIAA